MQNIEQDNSMFVIIIIQKYVQRIMEIYTIIIIIIIK